MIFKRSRRTSKWVPAALMALMLAFVLGVIGGCAGGSEKTEKPAVADNSGGSGTASPDEPADNGGAGGNGDGDGGSKSPGKPADNGGAGGKGDGVGGSKPPGKPADNGGEKEPVIVAENNAFRVFEPAEDAVVGKSFTVRGEARVFEAAFSYSFEDGHNILAEGHVMADKGAPEWGQFEFTVTFEEATSPFGILTIYESSAKDGSPVNKLQIAVKFAEDALKPTDEAE